MNYRANPSFLIVFFAIITFLLCNLHPALSFGGTLRALLIGIDEYQAPAITDLRGCANDVELMKNVLITSFDAEPINILVLKNKEATRKGIIRAIEEHLIKKAVAGDTVILHYSGHGSKMVDVSGDESDNLDETLVPHDARTEGVFDISDDEINTMLQQINRKTKYVTFIFDSCHSGSAARAGNAVRQIDPDARIPPTESGGSFRGEGDGSSDFRSSDSEYVLISGCLAGELSNESSFNNNRHGVLTWYLSQALISLEEDATYKSVMERVARKVSARFVTQHPQLEGKGIDLQIFGTNRISSVPSILIEEVNEGYVTLPAGKLYGLNKGSLLNVYESINQDLAAQKPVAVIRVIEAKPFSVIAEVVKGAVKSGLRAVPETLFDSGSPISIYLGGLAGDPLSRLRDALAKTDGVGLVENEQDATLIVEVEEGRILFSFGDLQQAVKPVLLSSLDWFEQAVRRVKNLAHLLTLQELANPTGNVRIDFSIHRKGDKVEIPSPQQVTPGTILTYRLKNLDTVPLFVYVLNISSDGSFTPLFPVVVGAQEQLRPGSVLKKDIETYLPPGHESVTDLFLAIATTTPIDPTFLERRSSRAGEEGGVLAPVRYLNEASRNSRGARPKYSKTWVTKNHSLIVSEKGVTLAGFALHFDKEKKGLDIQLNQEGSRSICSESLEKHTGDCLEKTEVSADGTQWLVKLKSGNRNVAERVISVGRAFEEAYEIQEKLENSVRVEPLLDVESVGLVNDHGVVRRDVSSDDTHDPAAEKDDLWHIRQIGAEKGWKLLRDKSGKAVGHEADSILIAHVDTGYLKHPETWQPFDGNRPIDAKKGYDYYDNDDDPTDPLLDDRFLDNPAHGTASGSVIISPLGCQLQGNAGCVNGIGRGAQLIPLRVHRTVSQFNSSNLSQAINDVAAGKIAGKPRLVSIAMGGPPTMSMWKALRAAKNKGILIVAAAGNYVRTVVWPARFSSTIGVAASNVRCRPWKNSSRGNRVDITAPGESVWRASYDSKNKKYFNGMGKGTTFATGNTSGAAAIWLAYHEDNPLFEQLREQGLVTQAFREALQKSSWNPDEQDENELCKAGVWDEENYGPGILNLELLLQQPLIKPEQLKKTIAELPDLPLFSSLFAVGTAPDNIRDTYFSIFREKRSDSRLSPEIFETEILYHYATDPSVQNSIDSLVLGTRDSGAIVRVSESLQKQDLSPRLRDVLSN